MIQGTKIAGSGTLVKFPVMMIITLPELRSVGNGGHVQNASGYDIAFTKSDCATPIGHAIESYDPVTGRLVAWVLMPSLVPGSNEPVHMYYGKSGVTVDPSSASVWVGYHGVWHFEAGSLNDNTGHGYNAANNGTTTQSPAYINDGRAASGTQWMQIGTFPDLTSSFSMSAWIYTTDNTYPGQRVFQDDENNTGGYAMSLGDGGTGMLRFYSRGSNPVILDSPANAILNNTWYYVTTAVDMTAMMKYIYINGALVASGSYTNAWGTDTGPATMAGETALGETANRFKGRLDEIRVSKTSLTAGWVQTEYNNQGSPGTFYTITSEYTAGGLCMTLPIELLDFEASNVNNERVALEWSTASEQNNDRFTVQRSRSGVSDWSPVAELPAVGTSTQIVRYVAEDPLPSPGINYYRLMQTDLDGTSTFSPVRAVEIGSENAQDLVMRPNPATSILSLFYSELDNPLMTIHDMHGALVKEERLSGTSLFSFEVGDLPPGIFLVTVSDARIMKSARLLIDR